MLKKYGWEKAPNPQVWSMAEDSAGVLPQFLKEPAIPSDPETRD